MRPVLPLPVKFFASIISRDAKFMEEALDRLKSRFGEADYLSSPLPFDWTDYYAKEMGTDLLRRVASFERLMAAEKLPEIKIFTNGVEGVFTHEGKRAVNIDPGYLTRHNLVLASCKDFSHRVYLGMGVYAEVTLIFRNGEYTPLPWTYPDYGKDSLRGIFKEIRSRYAAKLKEGGQGAK
ncbi:MAG: DUF4416 family protein [Deltaproteobacteria bacterium]|nr:DUF4416 family protein [Deltaproteobacteria bacterium]